MPVLAKREELHFILFATEYISLTIEKIIIFPKKCAVECKKNDNMSY
jgi:hypothetical protein